MIAAIIVIPQNPPKNRIEPNPEESMSIMVNARRAKKAKTKMIMKETPKKRPFVKLF